MVAGHFGFAAVVKSRERSTPLWALMLATQWLDVIFVPLFAAGIERLVPVPGSEGGYGQVIITADYTHSLVGAVALSVLLGGLAALRWSRRSAVVIGCVAFSHWVLDLVVHRGDMPILPGNAGGFARLGFGLWRVPAASIAVELALILVGAFLYWRAAAAASRAGDRPLKTAQLATGLLLASGLLTLALNAFGY